LRRAVIEMFRRQGCADRPADDVDREVIKAPAQTLADLYRALDRKDALIDRLVARLRMKPP
jgi:hypothetical protein